MSFYKREIFSINRIRGGQRRGFEEAFTDDQDAITKSGVVWVEICNSKSGTEKLIKEKPCEFGYNNFINF